jgi:hypothetical protein
MKIASALIGAAMVVGVASSSHAALNLVGNPGFETGDLTSWTTSGLFGPFDGVSTPLEGVTPYEGSYFLALGNYPSQGLAGVSQTLNTVAGQTYNVSLAWTDNGTNVSTNQSFEVLWDNIVIGSISGETGSTSWSVLSYSVKGTGSDTLALQGFSSSGYNDIDNVSVSAGVPEQGCSVLILTGAF